MIPVIMAGGSGTRLWPLSRTVFPKQFLSLHSHLSLLQETIARLKGLECEKALVICNEEYRFLVAEQLRQERYSAKILLEPVARNTAPAIALAALHTLHDNPEEAPIMLILAADHVIKDTDAFQQAVLNLLPAVKQGAFGTLGIVPIEPATGYGYINAGDFQGDNVLSVKKFVEKPDLITAEKYFTSGDYYWNSGIFMVRADRYLDALNQFRPDIYLACSAAMKECQIDNDFIRVSEHVFSSCPEDSIDYAIMEPLSAQDGCQVVMSPLSAGWSDVGSWSALWDITDKDDNQNAIMASMEKKDDDVIMFDTHNSFIAADRRLIAVLGVDNLVIVDTPDALLVASKDKVQNVKDIVAKVKASNRYEHYQHREVYRPWGKYDTIDSGERYQVKRITVKAGAKISVQMHHHRAEHWIVVSGTAKVTSGENVYLVTENESTYIPVGKIHCLENPGIIPLEIIEVQSGTYLGDDDIVRLMV